jgi:transposase
VHTKLGFQNFYLYSAVDIKSGEDFTLILPKVNTTCMNLFLAEMTKHINDKSIILVMDGAGWHHSKDLQIPSNIEIIYLPAYSPELNPVERLWLHIKQKIIKNKVYETITEIEDVVCEFFQSTLDAQTIKSICSLSYL